MLFPGKPVSTKPRVVITGAGIVTSLGLGWKLNAEGFRLGLPAFRPVTLFDVTGQRVKTAAEVDVPTELPRTLLKRKAEQRLERAGRMLLLAAYEAWEQAGWTGLDSIPIVLGTTSGGMSLGQHYYRHALQNPRSDFGQAIRVTYYQSQRQAMELCNAFGFCGPLTLISNACASGTNSIGHAFELIRNGHAERVLTGGYDAISHLVFSGFDTLQALSPTRCRPFDAHRDGLALGEGAAVLTIETLTSAQRRNASILGEIVGYGAATDCHHLTQPQPQGDAALASMQAATENAGLKPKDIGYINAHGTGTPLNDAAEAAAINRWAGDEAKNIPVSSTKSSIGHLLGAAGSVEAIICLMALREGFLPPSALDTKDPACEFPVVQEPTQSSFDYALSNSFGFGGSNATLILRRWS